jgi:pimeloyl-ACP methyl ester carboxylesterase
VNDVVINGRRIAYRRAGEGPPIVFLHGFFGDHRVWNHQLDLADSYSVVAWDAPGCGGSTEPPEPFRMADYADLLAAFIEAVGLEHPHVVGNSFGATLALELACRHPAIPRSVVAADGYAGWSGSFPPEVVADRLTRSLPDLALSGPELAAKWMPGFVTPAAPPAVVDELTAITADFRADGMSVMIRALADADLRDELPRMTVPTLLIWGTGDVRSPVAVGEDLRARIAGSRLVLIPGAGHLSQVEAPDRFNAEVRSFLQSVA